MFTASIGKYLYALGGLQPHAWADAAVPELRLYARPRRLAHFGHPFIVHLIHLLHPPHVAYVDGDVQHVLLLRPSALRVAVFLEGGVGGVVVGGVR